MGRPGGGAGGENEEAEAFMSSLVKVSSKVAQVGRRLREGARRGCEASAKVRGDSSSACESRDESRVEIRYQPMYLLPRSVSCYNSELWRSDRIDCARCLRSLCYQPHPRNHVAHAPILAADSAPCSLHLPCATAFPVPFTTDHRELFSLAPQTPTPFPFPAAVSISSHVESPS